MAPYGSARRSGSEASELGIVQQNGQINGAEWPSVVPTGVLHIYYGREWGAEE